MESLGYILAVLIFIFVPYLIGLIVNKVVDDYYTNAFNTWYNGIMALFFIGLACTLLIVIIALLIGLGNWINGLIL